MIDCSPKKPVWRYQSWLNYISYDELSSNETYSLPSISNFPIIKYSYSYYFMFSSFPFTVLLSQIGFFLTQQNINNTNGLLYVSFNKSYSQPLYNNLWNMIYNSLCIWYLNSYKTSPAQLVENSVIQSLTKL